MLEVGNFFSPLGDAEGRAHFSLWCAMKAPLLIGTDVTNMTAATLPVLIPQSSLVQILNAAHFTAIIQHRCSFSRSALRCFDRR